MTSSKCSGVQQCKPPSDTAAAGTFSTDLVEGLEGLWHQGPVEVVVQAYRLGRQLLGGQARQQAGGWVVVWVQQQRGG
jgi:hypothetical protein